MLRHFAALLCATAAFGQTYEIGANVGYGFYRNGTIFSSSGTLTAGIRNRFAAGVVFSEDMYDYVSGEVRYLYHDGHPFIAGRGVKTDIQGQSHTFTYDLLFHFKDRAHRFRPFIAGGVGAKDYVIAGPAPFPQPAPAIASLEARDEWKPVFAAGGGVKFRWGEHVMIRGEFRDYITTFPKKQIAPAANNTARGIFEQFTPSFGLGYVF
jgi:opacity protein-like surface antigen